MEVCEGSTTSHESDMGLSHANTIPTVCRTGRHLLIVMERSAHIGIGNAKVGAPFVAAEPQKLFTPADY